jgi:two-component sensor histidine kinase
MSDCDEDASENALLMSMLGHDLRNALDPSLLREMHHRMASTLTLLVGILRKEFGSCTTPGVRESLARFEAKIVAFGKLHRLLIVGACSGPIAVPSYVGNLCHALSEAVLEPLRVRCEVFANEGFLPTEICERLGLVIAELVTNAARHAFNGRKEGVVRVELIRTSRSWQCIVSDNGNGIDAIEPGIGSDELVRALGGKWLVRSGPDGTTVTVVCSI